MAALTKTSHTYATHGIPLECDVYSAPEFPADGPVFLFFHSGGLVNGARICVPSWLVQTCFKRKWPLISASYRLLPQVQGQGLLEDARAAYEFAGSLGDGTRRRVVVGGASAGAFMATLIAHHVEPKPLALLYITGIPTFRHPFFNTSVLLPPEPLTEEEMEPYINETVSVGTFAGPQATFYTESLLPSGARNKAFVQPDKAPKEFRGDNGRGMLYDYYLYENMFVPLVGEVDPGFAWATAESGREKLASWPTTIVIQGDGDDDVAPDVSGSVAKALGSKGILCVAPGQPHLFESSSFIEDEGPGMDAVREAVQALDKAVGEALAAKA